MKIEKNSTLRKGIPFLLLGLFLFLLYIYFFVGFEDIVNIFLLADPFYYSIALVMFLLSITFYSLAWCHILNILSIKTTFRKSFLFTWVAAFVDLLIPAESLSGEVSRTYLMGRDSKKDIGKVVASVVVHRILTMAITLAGMIVATTFFILRYELPMVVLGFILLVALGTAFSLFILIYLSLKEKATKRLVGWLLNLLKYFFNERLKGMWSNSKAKRMLKEFHKGIDILGKRPRKLILPIILSIMSWFFHILIAFFVFSSLHVSVPFSGIIIVFSITITIQTIPILVPGEMGIVEIVMTTLYTLLFASVTPAIATVATILIRALTLWTKLIISGVAVQWVGIKMLK